MKRILLLISGITLLASTGCFFPGHRGGGHEAYRVHGEYSGYAEPAVNVRIHAYGIHA
jgi:hypothetical protein